MSISSGGEDFRNYMQNLSDNAHQLRELNFSNTKKNRLCFKETTISIRRRPIDAYDELIRTLYEPEERKLEWAIGAIV